MRALPDRVGDRDGERGAALLLALVLVTAVALIGLAALEMGDAAFRADGVAQTTRAESYAAAGALDLLVGAMRGDLTWGRAGAPCAGLSFAADDGELVEATCTPTEGSGALLVGWRGRPGRSRGRDRGDDHRAARGGCAHRLRRRRRQRARASGSSAQLDGVVMRAPVAIGFARREDGFTLLELIVAVGIAALLAAVASLAVSGFADTGTSARCRADTLRLREAETTYFVAHDRYADETELVAAALLAAPSDLHDVVLPGAAYAITEVGSCIGQGSAYGIAAPTVGTTDHSGITVAVVAPDGSGVAGVAVSYQGSGDPSWTTMGMTDAHGRVTAALTEGVYDLRVAYDGALNTLSQVTVTNGTLVTFPAVPLTVWLRDAAGNGVAGGAISLATNGGSPSALGTTPASGDLVIEVLPSAYDVTLTYGSATSTHSAVTVVGPTVTTFQFENTVVWLRSSAGAGLPFGVVTATPAAGGASIALGATDGSGSVTAVLLDGTYDVTVNFLNETSTQTVTVAGASTITFRFVTVTVRLVQSTGATLAGGDGAFWYRPAGSSSWTTLGSPGGSGIVAVDVLPSNYDFQARWFGITQVQERSQYRARARSPSRPPACRSACAPPPARR